MTSDAWEHVLLALVAVIVPVLTAWRTRAHVVKQIKALPPLDSVPVKPQDRT